MSKEDIDIGKNIYSGSFSIAVANTVTQIIGADDNRTAIIISAPTANRVTISNDPNVADLAGMVMYAAQLPVEVDIEHFGDFVRKPIFGISNTGTNTIGVVFAAYSEKYS